MGDYVAVPLDDEAMPEAFRQALPVEPRRDQRLEEAIAAADAGARAPALPRPPALKRLKSMVEKEERDSTPIHRASLIRQALALAFPPDGDLGRDFARWLAAAKALQAEGLAGQKLAASGFLRRPDSMALDAALKWFKIEVGLNWATLQAVVNGVWYCNEAERLQYRIRLGPTITRGPKGEVFDSMDLQHKLLAQGAALSTAASGMGACIWVVADLDVDEPEFYSHICMMGRFHHSSFLSGQGIAAGGEWIIRSGALEIIGGASGHYRPEPWRFERALRHLVRVGAVRDGTQVAVYQQGNKRPFGVPCGEYLSDAEKIARSHRLYAW